MDEILTSFIEGYNRLLCMDLQCDCKPNGTDIEDVLCAYLESKA